MLYTYNKAIGNADRTESQAEEETKQAKESWCEATVQTRTEVMADFVLRGPGSSKALECRMGIEDSYGSCRCATVGLAEQVMRALLRREETRR